MSQISATMVKDLRAKTGAGIMDCREALKENAGDVEQAAGWLRQKGISKADKRPHVRQMKAGSEVTSTWVGGSVFWLKLIVRLIL